MLINWSSYFLTCFYTECCVFWKWYYVFSKNKNIFKWNANFLAIFIIHITYYISFERHLISILHLRSSWTIKVILLLLLYIPLRIIDVLKLYSHLVSARKLKWIKYIQRSQVPSTHCHWNLLDFLLIRCT